MVMCAGTRALKNQLRHNYLLQKNMINFYSPLFLLYLNSYGLELTDCFIFNGFIGLFSTINLKKRIIQLIIMYFNRDIAQLLTISMQNKFCTYNLYFKYLHLVRQFTCAVPISDVISEYSSFLLIYKVFLVRQHSACRTQMNFIQYFLKSECSHLPEQISEQLYSTYCAPFV